MKEMIGSFLEDVKDPKREGDFFDEILSLRERYESGESGRIMIRSDKEAIMRGVDVIKAVLRLCKDCGIELNNMEPGHGAGHLVRDYIGALMLACHMKGRYENFSDGYHGIYYNISPGEKFVGLVAGTLHDLSCAFVPRYEDHDRVIRHAEAGALFLMRILKDELYEPELIRLAYAVAAHTHYLKEARIVCRDGVERVIGKYQYEKLVHEDGIHFYFALDHGVKMTRWADRLECSGPSFLARHFLTLFKQHKDFEGEKGFRDVNFQDSMRLEPVGNSRTMLQHLQMFADSQSNKSPYGHYDFGAMCQLRNAQKARLLAVINAVKNPVEPPYGVMADWKRFLQVIEPGEKSAQATEALLNLFHEQLDEETKIAWINGFAVAMEGYREWELQASMFLNGVDPDFLELPGICEDVREFISFK